MPALGGWRRFVSKASLSYTAGPCLKTKQQQQQLNPNKCMQPGMGNE